MIRALALTLGLMALAACQTEDPPISPVVSTQNTNDTRIAKQVFGPIPGPSAQASEPLGFYSRGCQAGAAQLAETGPTWQAMRLSRNRNWGQPELIDYVQDLSRAAARLPGWNGIYVGDLSQPRGGPMTSGHASHQVGLDADIWLKPATRLDLSRTERENISSDRMDRNSGAYINAAWTPQHHELLRAAASDPRVARIFIFPGAKVAMCDAATGDRSWLNKIRPWYGHNYHFHVRLNCPRGADFCEDQPPPPPGDGCDAARQWVDDIVNPKPAPPPDPNAPAPSPKRELTMAMLPGQCVTVAASK